MKTIPFCTDSRPTEVEIDNRAKFFDLFKKAPLPDNELLNNLGLFINRQAFSRLLFIHDLYKLILPVHGNVFEFGVRFGQNMALFNTFRGIYEPFNHSRKVIGFDTFSGFPSVHPNDGDKEWIKEGAYGVTEDYEIFLDQVLAYHEQESPVQHIKKYNLVKGDASKTVPEYFHKHPETIVALAFFDFDLYEPTLESLKMVMKYVTKGSVLAFDELNDPNYPGETIAFREIVGLDRYKIRRTSLNPYMSYIIIE